MAKASRSTNPHMKKMVSLAKTLKGMHHKADGGGVKGDKYAPVRAEGINRLRTQSQQADAPAWRQAQGDEAQDINYIVRGRADGGGVKGDFSPSPRVAAQRMSQPEKIRARMGNGNPRLTQVMREMDMGSAQDIEDTVPRGGDN
jgi:hypothetical protein